MMETKEIYLMRHGETGLTGRYVGSSDVPLSSCGVQQTADVCHHLKSVSFDTVFCSPMLRCRQSIASLKVDCDIHYEEVLREIDFGRWEKKSFAEIAEKDRTLVDAWVSNGDTFCFPGGESMASFNQRVSTVAEYLRNDRGQRILVVCHGGVIRHLLCELLHLPRDKYLLFDVAPGCLTTINLYEEGGVLTGFNLRGPFCLK